MTPFKLRPRNHGGITTHVLDIGGNEMTTCELCDMRESLEEIRDELNGLSYIAVIDVKVVNTHINAAESHLETASNLLEGHYCPVPKWDGPDTVREAGL